ncbi:hypothetical protein Hypma_002980 [Hypsizygus marmoreus]|uniref:Uncharacterized protein n=1 Tax=Hypsizygus marmoreus TaxID=39966 RepID=A0A369J2V2_HYPMA|nr:hypothetical protein Hypma_002980 [Hypsizygus marmoreus]
MIPTRTLCSQVKDKPLPPSSPVSTEESSSSDDESPPPAVPLTIRGPPRRDLKATVQRAQKASINGPAETVNKDDNRKHRSVKATEGDRSESVSTASKQASTKGAELRSAQEYIVPHRGFIVADTMK